MNQPKSAQLPVTDPRTVRKQHNDRAFNLPRSFKTEASQGLDLTVKMQPSRKKFMHHMPQNTTVCMAMEIMIVTT